ncbi:hypothetical protein DM01DRAFT_1372470 [Hesseltinella vesiculosa]|uniref:Uncharacterized protein n=1 Tax=Hesseltinella vesiculosa TaxID=101127 RepID=A0A1X2GMQ7_9FUNG|nr:hypothetical protein DM01DRAFT_1372470 [Hesseltinella vesiculosa]
MEPPSSTSQSSLRLDNQVQRKKRYAANVLQRYSFQALYSIQHQQSLAKTRLDMMRTMTNLSKPVEEKSRTRQTSLPRIERSNQ